MKTRQKRGYTLIEMLLVIGIIIMMVSLVLISVNNMLRSSRMARAISLLVAAVDDCRTSAIAGRRTTTLDVTAMDTDGLINRMTVFGPGYIDNFENYGLPPVGEP